MLEAPDCVILHDCVAEASLDLKVHFATFEAPFWVTSQLVGVTRLPPTHSATFWPPGPEAWSTRVDVVQVQPAPGQLGPA